MSSLKRWLLPLLLLSLGVNLGLLLSLVGRQWHSDDGRLQPLDHRLERVEDREYREEPFRGPAEHLERLARRLGLDDSAIEPFLASQRSFLETTQSLRRQREIAKRGLHRELTQERPNREAIDQSLKELGQASNAMDRALAEHVLEARELLDGEAEKRYLSILEHLVSRRQGEGRPGSSPIRDRRRRP